MPQAGDKFVKNFLFTRIFDPVLLLIFSGMWFHPMAHGDSRLEEFIHLLDTSDDSERSFYNPRSPFYPYRHTHLDEGLTAAQKMALYQLQETGDCLAQVHAFAKQGFFGLYPHLMPVLDDQIRMSRIGYRLEYLDAPMVWRCLYYARRREFESRFDPTKFLAIDAENGMTPPRDQEFDPLSVLAWDKHYMLVFSLGRLAFCEDYPPSIRDVMRARNQPGGIAYSNTMAIYLAARADRHGIRSVDVTNVVDEFSRLGLGSRDILKLYREATTHRMHEMESLRGQFWHAMCLDWYREKRSQ